jgi:hypothetical protein
MFIIIYFSTNKIYYYFCNDDDDDVCVCVYEYKYIKLFSKKLKKIISIRAYIFKNNSKLFRNDYLFTFYIYF